MSASVGGASQPTQAIVHVDVRPIRLAYLVRQGSREDFRTAALEASSRWGGIQEFVIPFRRNGRIDPIWDQMLALFPVDYFCAIDSIPDETRRHIEGSYHAPVMSMDQFQMRWYGLHAIGAQPPARLQGLEIYTAATPDDVVLLASLGGLASDEQMEGWAGRGALIRASPESVNSMAAQLAGNSLISATGHQCGETLLQGSPGGPMLIWVAKPNSLSDALHFWNTRALIPLRLSTMKACIVTPQTAADPHVRQLVASTIAGNAFPMQPDVVLYSQTISVADREVLARGFGLAQFAGRRPKRDPLGTARNVGRATSAKTTWDPLNFVGGDREPGQRASTLTLLMPAETIVRVPSPVEFNSSIGGEVRARFSGPDQFKLPPGASLGGLFHDVAIAHKRVVEIQTSPTDIYEFRLRIPSPSALLSASLGGRGITSELSDKGRLAAGSMELARDPSIFRSEEVLWVIDALTTHRYAYELKEAQAQLGDGEEKLEELVARFMEIRQVSKTVEQIKSRVRAKHPSGTALDIGGIVSQLVDAGLAIRGLVIDCAICRFPTFIELNSVQTPMPCPACGARARFVTAAAGEPALHYRLNALLDRSSDNGVLGHLVGMAALKQDNPAAFALPGMNLQLPGIGPREVDLLALVDGEIGCGEAKTSAAGFTKVQLARDIEIAKAIGAAVYLMVCLQPMDLAFKQDAAARCVGAGLRGLCVEGAAGPLTRIA